MLFRIHGYNGGILNVKLVRLTFPSQPENVEIFVEQIGANKFFLGKSYLGGRKLRWTSDVPEADK